MGTIAKGKYQEWLKPEKLALLQGWARDGLTDEQIAHNMGIHRDTLNEWRKTHTVISDAIKKGKEVADYMVESALFKKACNGDTVAMIFWLCNRRGDKWRRNPQDSGHEQVEDDGLYDAIAKGVGAK